MRNLVRGSWTDQKCRSATLKVLKEIEARFAEIEALWGDNDETLVDEAGQSRLQTEKLREQWVAFWAEQDAERRSEA